jgi:iron complex transport system substrate-binding protein
LTELQRNRQPLLDDFGEAFMEAAMIRATLLALALPFLAQGGATPSHPAPAGKPKRIVSLNLCADQLVLALADRGQIAGLTRNAADTDMSSQAAKARGLPILKNSAEQILAIDPDLVVGMPARRSAAMGVLKDQHYHMLDLKTADSLDDIYGSIRETAAAVGHPERGEAMIAGMQAALAKIGKPGRGKVAAYYQRRGYMTGTGTLIDDLMQRVGLVNLAVKLNKPVISQLSLEEMVAARPDYLIVESATDKVADQGTEMLHHPALAGIPRISIPQAWTVCGSAAYVDAARGIAGQLVRHQGR